MGASAAAVRAFVAIQLQENRRQTDRHGASGLHRLGHAAESRVHTAAIQVESSMSSATAPSTTELPPPTFLRLSAGFVYFYFGFLKFFPDLSPGELLAGQTLMRLSWHRLEASDALWLLACVECVIGLSFLFNIGMKYFFILFLFHQASTFIPLVMFPELTFKVAPFAPTMEGQYILKNLVSLAVGWTVMMPVVKAAWAKPAQRRVRSRARIAQPPLANRP